MRIYLAARFSRREELRGYMSELEAMGHEVTSRWLTTEHRLITPNGGIADPREVEAMNRRFALEDLQDIDRADVVVSFTEPGNLSKAFARRGGRHVEFGYALASGKLVVVIGHRENVFHWLSLVEFFPTWEACKAGIWEEIAA